MRRKRKRISSARSPSHVKQQAKSWELRAAMSLARLWRDQGKRAASARTARSGLRVVYGGLRHARSEGGEGAAGGVGDIGLFRAMSIFHKTSAAGLKSLLYATTVPLFAFSCVSLGAQQSPWEGCRAASKTEHVISPRVLTKVENVVTVEPVGEFELKGIRRPLAAYNVVAAVSPGA